MHFNKKGDENPTWTYILYFFIGLVLLVFMINNPFVKRLFGVLQSEQEQATVNNFKELAEIASSKLDNKSYFYQPSDFFISNQFILVGFNKDNEGSEDECGPETVIRPSSAECKDSACLCLYHETTADNDFDYDDLPRMCKKVSDADYIFTLDYYKNGNIKYTDKEAIYKNIIGSEFRFPVISKYYNDKYARFFIYGQCEDFSVDENFGIQRLYIEKIYDKEAGKTFLFIADISIGESYKNRLEPTT